MMIRAVYVTDPNTMVKKHYPSAQEAAKAIGATEGYVRKCCHTGDTCCGFYCEFGEAYHIQGKHNGAKPNICFDYKNACGKCSWSAADPDTGKLKYEPVPGWTAEKSFLKVGKENIETYHITACPQFEPDEPRKEDYRELTFTEYLHFLENVNYLLKRWEHG